MISEVFIMLFSDELSFYDVREGKTIKTSDYTLVKRRSKGKTSYVAVARIDGRKVYRLVNKSFYESKNHGKEKK